MKQLINNIIVILIIIIIVTLLVGGIGFTIWVHIHYANTPIGEIPAWAGWIMFK